MEMTLPCSTMTPSATSERAPMKQSSSMMTGPAWSGSSTPPRPTPPLMWQLAPTWAQLPTVDQVSIMVPAPTRAPTLMKQGIRTAPGAMKAERRMMAPGTARKPASAKWAPVQCWVFRGTLSKTGAPAAPGMGALSFKRKESRTACLSQAWVIQPAWVGSATRRRPESSACRAASTGARVASSVAGERVSRRSQRASIRAGRSGLVMRGLSRVGSVLPR